MVGGRGRRKDSTQKADLTALPVESKKALCPQISIGKKQESQTHSLSLPRKEWQLLFLEYQE